MLMHVPIGAGELIDKLTILAIKRERITDPVQRRNVEIEHAALEAVRDEHLAELDYGALALELRAVNEALWDIEDELRACERTGDFSPRFVELARSVYKTNDRRAALKRALNELAGSTIVEEKSYAPYTPTGDAPEPAQPTPSHPPAGPGSNGRGRVIFLNGPSSAGKTTLAKQLQAQLDEPWLRVSADDFLVMMPKAYYGLDPEDEGRPSQGFLAKTHELEEGPRIDIEIGPYGDRTMLGMHRAIVALADAGNDVIVDHVLLDPRWTEDCAELLRHHEVLYVEVTCSLEVLLAREAERDDRQPGHSRGCYEVARERGPYDLHIDTSTAGPETCAERVIAELREPREGESAFEQIRARARARRARSTDLSQILAGAQTERRPVGALVQVGMVVEDIEASVAAFSRLLGQDLPEILVRPKPGAEPIEYRGLPSAARAKLTFFRLGELALELIEPMDEHPSVWREQLTRHGPGLHHLGFRVADLGAATAQFHALGVMVAQRGRFSVGSYAYLDTVERLGVQIELLEIHDGVSR